MSRDIIKRKDSDFNQQQNQIVAQTIANAAAWQIPLSAINNLQPLKTNWDNAWLIARNRSNRTPVQTHGKDLARAAYEPALRNFLQKWVVHNEMMSDADITSCGVKSRKKVRTPVGVPDTIPYILPVPKSGHRIEVRFQQEQGAEGVSRRGKPKGIAYCELAYNVGSVPPASASECPNRLLVARSPANIMLPFNATGKFYCFARWVNPKGEAGAWTNVKLSVVF